jgi:hypothetical protein
MAGEPSDPLLDVIPPPTPEETVEGVDSLSEEIAISSGRDLKSQKTKNEIDKILRESAVQTHLHRIVVIGLYALAISALLMFLTVVYHLLVPFPFLPPEKIADIKQLLFSGAVGAGASGLAKKYLGIGADNKT